MCVEEGLALEWSVDNRFLWDGMETGVDGLGIEPVSDGREDTLFREHLPMVSWQPVSSVVKRTSTLITLRRPRPMGGANSWMGARKRSDPIVLARESGGCGMSSWLLA